MKKILSILAVSLALGSCSKSAGDNYIGQWQMDKEGRTWQLISNVYKNANKSTPLPIISISKSGDIYLIKSVNDSYAKMAEYCPTGATLKDAKLVCSPDFELTFDQSTETLLTTSLGAFTKINK